MSYKVCPKSNLANFDKVLATTILSNIYIIDMYFMMNSIKQI